MSSLDRDLESAASEPKMCVELMPQKLLMWKLIRVLDLIKHLLF
jgi:hypothetical protein